MCDDLKLIQICKAEADDGLIIMSPACLELLHGLIFIHITSLRARGLLHTLTGLTAARRKLQNVQMNYKYLLVYWQTSALPQLYFITNSIKYTIICSIKHLLK